MKKASDRERADFARRPFKEQLMDLFALHAGERRGTILLMMLIGLMMTWYVYQQWFRGPEITDMGQLQMEMEAWLAAEDPSVVSEATPVLFAFDPNTTSREQWKQLGLTDRQIDGLERYKARGGRFRVKSDLARMYTIKPEQYERLKSYIQLPDSQGRPSYADRPRYEHDSAQQRWPERPAFARERAAFPRVEVNTADTNMLVALPGIGPSFARGIVKYRESLGGYCSLDQLAEVLVLKDKPDAVARLKDLLVLDTSMVRRIPVNTCTVEELAAHPYARWKIARPLIAYRTQHGPFTNVVDITACAVVTEEVFRKLAPYLTVE